MFFKTRNHLSFLKPYNLLSCVYVLQVNPYCVLVCMCRGSIVQDLNVFPVQVT